MGRSKPGDSFFFQAEDGIRDFCLSRGLGDVYKRQPHSADDVSAGAPRQAPSLTRVPCGRHSFIMPNIADSPASTPPADEIASLASPSRHGGLLVKIETDRRLGHEWDEWNGQPLANGGDFRTTAAKFFLFTAVGLTAIVVASAAGIFLLAPRLAQLAERLPRALYLTDAGLALAGFTW